MKTGLAAALGSSSRSRSSRCRSCSPQQHEHRPKHGVHFCCAWGSAPSLRGSLTFQGWWRDGEEGGAHTLIISAVAFMYWPFLQASRMQGGIVVPHPLTGTPPPQPIPQVDATICVHVMVHVAGLRTFRNLASARVGQRCVVLGCFSLHLHCLFAICAVLATFCCRGVPDA